MKSKISLFIVLFLIIFSVQAGKREQVMIILGDPGLITTISYTNLGKEAAGSRGYMGKRFDKTQFKVSKFEFLELWEIVNSESFEGFEFEPTNEDNMAHPDFYNLTVINGRKEKSMRIPRNTDFSGFEKLELFIVREK